MQKGAFDHPASGRMNVWVVVLLFFLTNSADMRRIVMVEHFGLNAFHVVRFIQTEVRLFRQFYCRYGQDAAFESGRD